MMRTVGQGNVEPVRTIYVVIVGGDQTVGVPYETTAVIEHVVAGVAVLVRC